ncbi:MAG: VacJ family lipoprotein [Syntrophales bacterium]|nr:VacJ family lipoprotein [Syntrophales bacterium]
MKSFLFLVLLFAILAVGCAHSPYTTSTLAPPSASLQPQQVTVASKSEQIQLKSPDMSAKSESKSLDDNESLDYVEEEGAEERVEIADPLEPFNRAMYHFNDKLYFWVLKPVAQGYRKVVPEGARVSVSNFFSNITFPIRFVNCLLQANFEGAASEFARFTVNTIWGIGGLLDPASSKDINLPKQDEDFGQSLGVYGLGQGFYINWPFFGPSSSRDTVGLVGDYFLHPFSYVDPWYAGTGTRAYGKVNDTSLKIGDYESLKEAAIDPYVAIRDAYVQYRQKKVKARGAKPEPSSPGGVSSTSGDEEAPPGVRSGEAPKH